MICADHDLDETKRCVDCGMTVWEIARHPRLTCMAAKDTRLPKADTPDEPAYFDRWAAMCDAEQAPIVA